MTTAPQTSPDLEAAMIDPLLMRRVFRAFVVLAVLAVLISIAGKWLGHAMVMAGHSGDPSPREIVIGNNVLSVPANTIRFDHQRADGVASRLDLYLRWPDLDGYSSAARDDFNHVSGPGRILFVSIEPRIMSRDMSGRFEPIYRFLIQTPGIAGPAGIAFHEFQQKTGYMNERLAVAERPGRDPFVARCLTGGSAADSLAPCERDIQFGDDLSATYRFPRELLASWRTMDAAVAARLNSYLRTAR